MCSVGHRHLEHRYRCLCLYTVWGVTAIKFKPSIVAHTAFRLRSTRAGGLQEATILSRGD